MILAHQKNQKNLRIYILRGSSSQGIIDNYIESSSILDQSISTQNAADPFRLRYFSDDRITVEPGTTITVINQDAVSHSILSGKENYGDRHNPFTSDGRISTGVINPEESINITFDDAGFLQII